MAFEDYDRLEQAYPYRVGWKAMSCAALVLAAVGAAGLMFLPFGCDQVQNGDPTVGWVVIIGGLCTTPFLLLALAALVKAGRDLIGPPLLRVTPTALLLPADVRGPVVATTLVAAVAAETGEPAPDAPRAHPEEIPFARIRWARRETTGSAGWDKLLIVHDLGPATLELLQNMMRPADFDELDAILRAAVPEAFAAAPPTQGPNDE
jgi:hypothetical protein